MKNAEGDGDIGAGRVYEFGDYRLDVTRRLLWTRAGDDVTITSRALDTLIHLIENPGRVVGKRELMDAVWPGAVVEENNLTQAISTLRQILGERPGEHRYIATVPSRGYRLIATVSPVPPMRTASDTPTPAAPDLNRTAAPARTRVGRGRLVVAGMAIAALIAVVAALWSPARDPTGSAIRSIAVLPFKPVVPEAGDPALELGMADILITRLSTSAGIVVRPLGSVRGYTRLDQDPVAAGRELGVDAVLDGSILREGPRLRVTVRLIRVLDGASIWVDQLDQGWTDLFGVQDSITERLAGALALSLSNEERSQMTRKYTEGEVAYRLYLLGRYHWSKLTPPELEKSIEYLQRAIDEDQQYALAHAGIAEAYRALAITSDRRPTDVLPRGKAAALRAIELDDRLDSAWASLCFIQIWSDWDWPGAERSCQRALAINANSADGHRAYAILLSDLGRHDEAVTHARRASELDPLTLVTTAIEAHVLLYAGFTDHALERLRATLELDPDFWIAHLFTGKALLDQGRFEDALAEFIEAERLSHGNSETVSMIGYTRARLGDTAGAMQALAALQGRRPPSYVPPLNVAMIHAGLGDEDAALEWLERALAGRDVRMTFLGIERKWDPLRSDPRFRSLMARLRLD
jgi:serine/threonine-protein kinase